MNKGLFRILDANLNRSREGLRVCEEIARFTLEDAKLTSELKNLRHRISRSIKKFPGLNSALLKSRDSCADVGREITAKSSKKSCRDLFSANIQRVKESLRVLEEFSALSSQALSKNFARLRFKAYGLEKKILARL